MEGKIVKHLKTLYVVLPLLLITIFVIGINYTSNSDDSKLSNGSKIEEEYVNESQKIEPHGSFDDLIKSVDNIVTGTIIDGEEFNDMGTMKFTLEVENNIKSDTVDRTIDVYQAKELLNVGDKYLLFLYYNENPLFPRTAYTPSRENILLINDNLVIGAEKYFEDTSADHILQYISSSSSLLQPQREVSKVIEQAGNLEELMQQSDHIIHFKPISIFSENLYVIAVYVEVIQKYKGKLDASYPVFLPSSIEIGEEYLVFFKDVEEGVITLSTRNDSVISKKDTKKWSEILVKVQEIK